MDLSFALTEQRSPTTKLARVKQDQLGAYETVTDQAILARQFNYHGGLTSSCRSRG